MSLWTEFKIEDALAEIGRIAGTNQAAQLIVNNPSGFGRVLVIYSRRSGGSEEFTSNTISGAIEMALSHVYENASEPLRA